jgi:type I restriction enzyme S subunit
MSGWRETTLGEVCELYQPKTISSAELVADGEYPVYGANGIIGRFDKFNHAEPQLLVTCRGATCGAVNISQPNSWINGNAMVVKPRDSSIELGYLKHMFQGGVDLSAVITGAAQPQITRQSLAPLKVRIPKLPEQRRIADILDRADALRAKRRAAIARLDELTQAVFVDMFCPNKSSAWPERTLTDVADVITGFAFKSEEYVESGDSIRLCRGTNVLPGRIDWDDLAQWPAAKIKGLEAFDLHVGDVVIAMDRPWISEGFKLARISPEDYPALLVQRVARIRANPKYALDSFLYGLLGQPAFTRHCKPTETTVPHISPLEIRAYSFRLPPVELQEKFDAMVAAVHQLRLKCSRSLAYHESLFVSLQDRAFRGAL